jgi:hypothetical protein
VTDVWEWSNGLKNPSPSAAAAPVISKGSLGPGNITRLKYRQINFERYYGGMDRIQAPPLAKEELAKLSETSPRAEPVVEGANPA